eukprot:gene7579-8870_t
MALSWLSSKIGGKFQQPTTAKKDDNAIYENGAATGTQLSSKTPTLSREARDMIDNALAPFLRTPSGCVVDHLVNLFGIGADTNCQANKEIRDRLHHPIKYIKFKAFSSACAVDDLQQWDRQYVDRVVQLTKNLKSNYPFGRCILSSIDKRYDFSGNALEDLTGLYIPNDYLLDIVHDFSDLFNPHLGNPLLLRRPLDLGVKIVAVHCGGEGKSFDYDEDKSPLPLLPNLHENKFFESSPDRMSGSFVTNSNNRPSKEEEEEQAATNFMNGIQVLIGARVPTAIVINVLRDCQRATALSSSSSDEVNSDEHETHETVVSPVLSNGSGSGNGHKRTANLQKRLMMKKLGDRATLSDTNSSSIDTSGDDEAYDDEEFEEDEELSSPTSPLSFGTFLSDTEADFHHDHMAISGEGEEGDDEVPLIRLFQKFLNIEAIKSLKHRHHQLNNKIQRLKKAVDTTPAKLREKGQSLKKEKEKIKELIKLKKNQLNHHMSAPPFLRLMDKFAYTAGLFILFISEFVMIRAPQYMYLWYTILIFPLMAIRFVMYHRSKYHYFMLDFCYLCQFFLIFYLFGSDLVLGSDKSPALFKLVFALSNGPLAWGTVVWRNSLVFHDVDKLTSVFIHLCPPIVTYCLRWYPNAYSEDLACGGTSCELTFREAYLVPIYVYIFWQIFYYVKTEVVDGVKLANDQEIMTSTRWMSVRQPHPLYKFFKQRGIDISPGLLLMATQMIYTLCTLLALPLFMNSFWAHSAFLVFIFAGVSWNGACYYFEVFSENYNKRFKSEVGGSFSAPPCNSLTIPSILSFAKFLAVFLPSLFLFLKFIL